MSCQVNFPLQDIVILLREKINPEIIGAVPEEKLEEEVLAFIQPKIDELQEQLTKLPPEIHVATQVLEGTVLKTTLNNGKVLSIDFSPLFSRFDGLLSLYDKNVAAGGGTDGWTTESVVENGLTQKQINARVAVKFIKADENGLTKWDTFKKPPYTTNEYKQAYDNGINLGKAIKKAYDDGFNSVVLERGNYPFLYDSTTNQGAVRIINVNNMDVDLNGSTLFAIYDSNNRSPYDKTNNPIYKLGGAIMRLEHSLHTKIRNGIFRGDHYNRSYTNSDEKNTENTTGLFYGDNVRYSKVLNCEFHGFRADGLCSLSSGIGIVKNNDINIWYAGGIDTTGNEISETGSYRTIKIDLQGKTIYNNAINLSRYGYLRAGLFREEFLTVAFYDANGAFISAEKTIETQDVILPTGTRYVRYVAYGDERTDATVSYGDWLALASGQSRYALVEQCKFYRNMRGCVSNFIDRAIFKQCTFEDSGVSKSEVVLYGSTTRYAINYEDVYVGTLVVDGCVFNNVGSAILAGCRYVSVKNSKFTNLEIGAVVAYDTTICEVSDNYFRNVGYSSFEMFYNNKYIERYYTIKNNTYVDCQPFVLSGKFSKRVIFKVLDNTFVRARVTLVDTGDGNTIYTSGNRYIDPPKGYFGHAVITNAASINNEYLLDSVVNTEGTENYVKSFTGKNVNANKIIVTNDFTGLTVDKDKKNILTGCSYAAIGGKRISMGISGLSHELDNSVTKRNDITITKCDFTDIIIKNSLYANGANPNPTNVVFDSVILDNSFFRDHAFYNNQNTLSNALLNVTFNNCDIDVTNIGLLVNLMNAENHPVKIVLNSCRIKSQQAKSVRVCNLSRVNINVYVNKCILTNVSFTDPNITYDGQVKINYDPPSLATATQQSTTVALTGAKLGDNVSVSFDKPSQGTHMWAEVTSADTVTVYHRNDTGATVDLPSGTLTVKIV